MKIGLMGFWIGDCVETSGHVVVSNSSKVAKAVSINTKPNVAEAESYADDGLDDSISAVTKYELELVPNGVNEELLEAAGIVKETVNISGTEKEMFTFSTINEGAYKSLGFIKRKRMSGVTSYEINVYTKVKFTLTTDESSESMKESISFANEQINAKAYQDCDGHYVLKDMYATLSEATAAINTIFGIA